MPGKLHVHLTAAGLLALLIGVIALFWAFPKLLLYLLLAMVAVLAYGALYLILAAKLDPEEDPSLSPRPASPGTPTDPDEIPPPVSEPQVAVAAKEAEKSKKKTAKKKTAKKKTAKKKTAKKKTAKKATEKAVQEPLSEPTHTQPSSTAAPEPPPTPIEDKP